MRVVSAWRAALAQNTWGSPQVVTTPSDLAALTSTIGRAPGFVP
jgi:hypothetical protein